jgi:RNA recognition motif-containing protein
MTSICKTSMSPLYSSLFKGPGDLSYPVAWKTVISNLYYGVTETDLEALFTECGFVIKATIHKKPSGGSRGTGSVLFKRKSEAFKAQNLYNGVLLDGRPMKIKVFKSRGVNCYDDSCRVGQTNNPKSQPEKGNQVFEIRVGQTKHPQSQLVASNHSQQGTVGQTNNPKSQLEEGKSFTDSRLVQCSKRQQRNKNIYHRNENAKRRLLEQQDFDSEALLKGGERKRIRVSHHSDSEALFKSGDRNRMMPRKYIPKKGLKRKIHSQKLTSKELDDQLEAYVEKGDQDAQIEAIISGMKKMRLIDNL